MQVPYKKSTVHDVAILAGVSQSAVSHYINGRVSVCSQETAERIKHAIEELHFTPARALRYQGRRATNTIGVCVSLPSEDQSETTYTYLHQFWSGVSGVVDKQSYRIMHFPKSMRNAESCNPFLDGGIDGLLISANSGDKRIDVLSDAGLPTVCVVRSSNLPAGCGSVVCCEADVVNLAMSHLCSIGHRHIGYFGAAIDHLNETAIKRHAYWRQWMERMGSDPSGLAVFTPGYEYPMAVDLQFAVDHWLGLESRPTALFCFNDRHAMSAMSAFKSRGLTLPDDLSVVGVDNESACVPFDPHLTSVDVPVQEIGRRATQMLIDMVRGTGTAERLEIPVTQLVVRASTCALANNAKERAI